MEPTIYILNHSNTEETSVFEVLQSLGFNIQSVLPFENKPKFSETDVLVVTVSSKRPQIFSFLQRVIRNEKRPSILVLGDRGDFLQAKDQLQFERSSILLRPFKVDDLVNKIQDLLSN